MKQLRDSINNPQSIDPNDQGMHLISNMSPQDKQQMFC